MIARETARRNEASRHFDRRPVTTKKEFGDKAKLSPTTYDENRRQSLTKMTIIGNPHNL